MIEDPQILRTEPQLTATLHLTVPAGEIRNVMGPGLAEVRATVAAQGIAITGPWFTHHLTRPAAIFNFEICVPVASPVAASGRVQPGIWPATQVVRTVYHGVYDNLGRAWAEFDAWVADNGHTPAPDLWERYLVDPGTSQNPADWRTELNRPLQV